MRASLSHPERDGILRRQIWRRAQQSMQSGVPRSARKRFEARAGTGRARSFPRRFERSAFSSPDGGWSGPCSQTCGSGTGQAVCAKRPGKSGIPLQAPPNKSPRLQEGASSRQQSPGSFHRPRNTSSVQKSAARRYPKRQVGRSGQESQIHLLIFGFLDPAKHPTIPLL